MAAEGEHGQCDDGQRSGLETERDAVLPIALFDDGDVDPAGPGPAVTTRYGHADSADTAWAQWTGTSMLRQLTLPGAVTVTLSSTGNTFAYPNLQGHTLTTGDGTTTSTGITVYDPYGQPLDPTTHAIGTTTADDHAPNNRSGWHQGAIKITDTTGTTAITEMGARLYVPTLGRFLQTDPIEGGVDNDYTWPTDPIGKADLDGRFDWVLALDVVSIALIFVPGGPIVGLAIRAVTVAARAATFAARTVKIYRGIENVAHRSLRISSFAAKSRNYTAIGFTFDQGSFRSAQSSFVYHYGKHGVNRGDSPLRYLARARAGQRRHGGQPGYHSGSFGGKMGSTGRWLTKW